MLAVGCFCIGRVWQNTPGEGRNASRCTLAGKQMEDMEEVPT